MNDTVFDLNNPEHLTERADAILAHLEGKPIDMLWFDGSWKPLEKPVFDSQTRYRRAPEPEAAPQQWTTPIYETAKQPPTEKDCEIIALSPKKASWVQLDWRKVFNSPEYWPRWMSLPPPSKELWEAAWEKTDWAAVRSTAVSGSGLTPSDYFRAGFKAGRNRLPSRNE